jgi:hypothetical protein
MSRSSNSKTSQQTHYQDAEDDIGTAKQRRSTAPPPAKPSSATASASKPSSAKVSLAQASSSKLSSAPASSSLAPLAEAEQTEAEPQKYGKGWQTVTTCPVPKDPILGGITKDNVTKAKRVSRPPKNLYQTAPVPAPKTKVNAKTKTAQPVVRRRQ